MAESASLLNTPTPVSTIRQGETYDQVFVYFSGDFTSFIPKGEIRTNFADKEGELLASFTFPSLVFGEFNLGEGLEGSYTLVRPQLSADVTRSLPLHRQRTVRAKYAPGRNCWVLDLMLMDDNNIVRASAVRYVEVLPSVTVL